MSDVTSQQCSEINARGRGGFALCDMIEGYDDTESQFSSLATKINYNIWQSPKIQ
jgi:hypothetical protein